MDGAVDDLERWAAAARAGDAAAGRVRERWLRQQAEEEATATGVLLRMAENLATVVCVTTSGRRHSGQVAGVGDDFVAVRVAGDRLVLIPFGALAEFREAVEPGRGDRPPSAGALKVTMMGLLEQAAGQRPRLVIQSGAAVVAGDLITVGTDVVVIDPEGEAVVRAYLTVASVSEISLFASG